MSDLRRYRCLINKEHDFSFWKLGYFQFWFLYNCEIEITRVRGVHIIPFLIPNGIGVESTLKDMKLHFICHCELWKVFVYVYLGMLTFLFFRKTIVSLWRRRQQIEKETIIFKNDRFFKVRFLKMVVFKTIVFQNDRFLKTLR